MIVIVLGMMIGYGLGENVCVVLIICGILEIVCVVVYYGGKKEIVFGLIGIGDLIVIVLSYNFRNFNVGLKIG